MDSIHQAPIYSESGVDLTLLRENLRRPLAARILQNASLVRFGQALRDSGKVPSAKEQPEKGNLMAEFDAPGLLRQLLKEKVDFVLIGGLAMIAQGSAYVTKDLDICYRRTPENIAAVAASLAPIHPYLRGVPPGLPFQFDSPTIQAGLNFTLVTDLGDLDLLGEVRGIGFYDQVLAQSEERDVLGMIIHVLTLDGLIAAKKAAARKKDQLHLLELEELKKLREGNP